MHLLDCSYRAALWLLLALLSHGCASAQRVAPGVNPQHYQQVPQQAQHHPPPPQQYQQQQHMAPGVSPQQYQQFEQMPVQQQQYQQAPIQQQQQMHQQVPVQQQQQHPPQQMHQQQQHAGGHHHGAPQQVLNTANIQHERAHIQEHMQVPIDTSKMSEAELQFHYFKMHDSDNNNKLDGCELIKSLIHWHVEEKNHKPTEGAAVNTEKTDETTSKPGGNIYTDKALEDVIDYVLKTMDANNDGYVDYAEYRKGESKIGKE